MTSPHKPNPSRVQVHEDSTAWHILAFFIRNPDEELTTLDAATKTNRGASYVTNALKTAVQNQYLNRSPIPNTKHHTYTPGPHLEDAAIQMHSINQDIPKKPAAIWPFPPKGGAVPMTAKQIKRDEWKELQWLGDAIV